MNVSYADYLAAIPAVTDPVGRAVLDLHREWDGHCVGDELGDSESVYPQWPCETVALVMSVLGFPWLDDYDTLLER